MIKADLGTPKKTTTAQLTSGHFRVTIFGALSLFGLLLVLQSYDQSTYGCSNFLVHYNILLAKCGKIVNVNW